MGSWDTRESTGLLHDVDVWVEKAYFGTDAGYDNGDTLVLIMEGTKVGPEVDPEDNTFRQFFSTGSKWEGRDNGKTAIHADGSEEFHASCAYARFFEAFMELSDDANKVIRKRGFPDEAKIWVGLGFHLERMKFDYGPPIGERDVLVPTAYLGDNGLDDNYAQSNQLDLSDDKPKKQTAAQKAKAAKIKAKSNGRQAELIEFAAEFESHDEFLTAAYDKWDEIEDFEEFADLIDENGTIWTTASA
jgi:hypothetical protein